MPARTPVLAMAGAFLLLTGAAQGGQDSLSLADAKGKAAIDDDVSVVQGAARIDRNNQPAGAIGGSGGSGQQDDEAATAGAAAL